MSDYLHGTEVLYLDNEGRPIEIMAASVIGLVATSDDADPLLFPLNVPVLINTEAQLKKSGTTGTLRTALQDIYDHGVCVVVVIRVDEDAEEAPQIANVIGQLDNETNTYGGIKGFMFAESVLGVRPRILIAPEFSHKIGVGAELESVAIKMGAIAIVDGSEKGFSAVVNEAKLFGPTLFVNCGIKKRGVNGEIVTRKSSAFVAGHIVRVDNEEGYWNSPSSRKMIGGIIGTSEAIDHGIGSKTSKANLYNAQNVSVIVQQEGGWFFFGNRLANGTMIPHQRIRNIVGDSILYAHQEMLDRNITKSYVDGVKGRVNALLRRLISRDVISGGECWLDKDLNVAAIGTAQVYWDYDLGFYDIAERMTFRQHITDRYNEAVFS